MDISLIRNTSIFQNMNENEIQLCLKELSASIKAFPKNKTVYHAGTYVDTMGLVLEGSVTIESNDIWGNKTILSHVGKNEYFAETYAILKNEPIVVDVVTNEKTSILFLRTGILSNLMIQQNSWATKLVHNLLLISTQKNLLLAKRSFHTSYKTIRARVMSYLNSLSIQFQQDNFDIPFNRQQMADYLNIERTALSKELRKMKDDHLIDYHKNHFRIINNHLF